MILLPDHCRTKFPGEQSALNPLDYAANEKLEFVPFIGAGLGFTSKFPMLGMLTGCLPCCQNLSAPGAAKIQKLFQSG